MEAHLSLFRLLCLTAVAVTTQFASAGDAARVVISAGMPGAPTPPAVAQHARRVADIAELGRKLFSDRSLSASGSLACASCHDPAHAYGPPDDRPVRTGGEDMKHPGTRAVPSLRYLQTTPPYGEHQFEDEGSKPGEDNGPTGGFTFDGRVNSLHEQARIPLLAEHEMANIDAAGFVGRLRRAVYANEFRRLFGKDVFDQPEKALAEATKALEYFQQSPRDFYPYSSKYDAFLRGQARLSESELRGLGLFNDPEKGNCASCHPSAISSGGAFPQFTDYGYAALGVPRNMHIEANVRPDYYDLGLCGPERKDLADNENDCGLFKVPSLRNVARKKVFFHNGSMDSLEQVVRFYIERETVPAKWYPRTATGIRKYDDMPEQYHHNIEQGAPFSSMVNGKPRLDDKEISEIVAFLKTLDDGYAAGGRARP